MLNKSKILCNTSTSEGFPNTYVQALAYGVPIVTLNIDPDNIISKNNIGYNARGDLNEACNHIKLLLSDKQKWMRLSRNCYNYASKNLNIISSVDQLEILFNSK